MWASGKHQAKKSKHNYPHQGDNNNCKACIRERQFYQEHMAETAAQAAAAVAQAAHFGYYAQ